MEIFGDILYPDQLSHSTLEYMLSLADELCGESTDLCDNTPNLAAGTPSQNDNPPSTADYSLMSTTPSVSAHPIVDSDREL